MLSKVLKELLSERKMTLQQLADQAGIPIETMRNIYYDKVHDPKVSTMIAISKALNVSVNYLMGDMLHNPEETEIIRNYRKCGIHGKSIIELIAKYEANIAGVERNAAEKHKVPCLIPVGNVYDGIVYSSCEVVDVDTILPEAYLAIEITTNFFAPVYCKGDTYVDDHHSTEDIAIALGSAFRKALGDKRGIKRYGDIILPMDEALVLASVDISGRSYIRFTSNFQTEKIGTFDVELLEDFFTSFAENAGITLHIRQLDGRNSHHIAEAMFKAVARALRKAVEIDERAKDEIPSTKGVL